MLTLSREQLNGVKFMGNNKSGNYLNISTKSFIGAIAIIFALMVLTYALSFIVPAGEYARTTDAAGNVVIDTAKGFSYVEGGIPFWRWILSPFLVLGAEGNAALIAVIIFLLVIGGVFNSLNASGLMQYMLDKIVHKFGDVKYKLMAILILFFMAMGSLVGSFEEVVPMVPIVVSLAVGLGWDKATGLSISLLAAGCGFAAGVANPFTIGVAQGLAGLPMFSGMWLRLVSFALIYLLLLAFTRRHARKVDRHTHDMAQPESRYVENRKMDRALKVFAVIVGAGILLVLSSSFIAFLRDFTMIIVAVMFLAAGIIATLLSGTNSKTLGKTFGDGIVAILPSVLMILMASSIKYTMVEAKILDTVLHGAVQAASGMSKAGLVLFIYLIVLVMNFFIASGSAKAFLLIPLIVPLAGIFGISPQLCILAFAFGDGFSNVFYPTNPVLLISLGIADLNYADWIKFSLKFQIVNILLTSAILMLGLAVNYV